MKGKQTIAFFVAILLHVGLLLVGGLLLFRPSKAKGPAAQDVDVAVDAPEKKEEVKDNEKDLTEQKDIRPDAPAPELQEAAPA